MKKISMTDAAKYAEITRDKARYWLKLLDLKIIKENRVLFIPAGGEKLLQAMKNAISSGLSPALAAKEVLEIHALPVAQKAEKNLPPDAFLDRVESLEKAVMLLVDQNKKLATTVETQNNQIAKLTRQLTPPKYEPKKIEVWHPEKKKAPKLSAFQKFWYELTNPVKLRAI